MNAIEQGRQKKDRPTRQFSVTSDLCSHSFTVSGVHAPAVLEILSVSFLSFQGAVGVQYIAKKLSLEGSRGSNSESVKLFYPLI